MAPLFVALADAEETLKKIAGFIEVTVNVKDELLGTTVTVAVLVTIVPPHRATIV